VKVEIVLFSGQPQGLGAIPELNFTPYFRIVVSGLRHNRVIQGSGLSAGPVHSALSFPGESCAVPTCTLSDRVKFAEWLSLAKALHESTSATAAKEAKEAKDCNHFISVFSQSLFSVLS
jgi:hypothetical protein